MCGLPRGVVLVNSPSFESFNLCRVRLVHIFLELGSQDQSKLLAFGALKNQRYRTVPNKSAGDNGSDVAVDVKEQ